MEALPLLVVCTNAVSVNPSTGLAMQVIAIEQQDREKDCRMWAKSVDPDPVLLKDLEDNC